MSILATANDLLVDFDGNIAYLTNDYLYTHDVTDTTETGGYVTTNNSDLGHEDVDKLVNFIDIDYIGTIQVLVYQDGTAIHLFEPPDKSTRGTKWLYMPLIKRKAFQKIEVKIGSSDPDAIVYGVVLDFSVLKRRRTS